LLPNAVLKYRVGTLDTSRIDGKVAVVTGAGRGLGRAAARALAEAGAQVVLLGRSADQLAEVAHEVESLGRRALALPTDVTDEAAVERAAKTTLAEMGRVDILINNAGIARVSPLLSSSLADFRQQFDVNVVGLFLCARAFGAPMVAQRNGRVVNVASVAGLGGENNLTGYCATKGAVIAFTRALAVEWARHQVTVNALAPGYFATDLNAAALSHPEIAPKLLREIPLRRFGEAPELGPLIVYLASDASAYMTGSVLVIDGGQTAH
jgi:NAD(P)-dependent dehydrogenase (short-subunit alcohol dehydrogenase family)